MKTIETVEDIEDMLTVIEVHSQSESDTKYYLKIWKLAADKFLIECTCWGFRRWKHCKHVESYLILIGENT